MATLAEFLDESIAPEPVSTGFTLDDFLADANQPTGFQPVAPPTPSRERQQRLSRLGIIRQKAAAGEPVDFGDIPLTTDQLAQRSTIRVGDQQVAAGGSAFADTPSIGRGFIIGAAAFGAAIENPILKLRGRGDLADQNIRNLNNLREYSRRLAQEGGFGETAGGVIHDVAEALALGTLAAPFGGPAAGKGATAAATKAAATRQLAASSVAFGIDGADRVWHETEHLPHARRMDAWYRQFGIDFITTFVGGRIVQDMGLFHGRYFGQAIGKAAGQAAERSGLNTILGSALADGGVEGLQGSLSYLNRVSTGLEEFTWDGLKSNFLTSAAVGGLAGAATSGVQKGAETVGQVVEFDRAVKQFQKEFPKAVEGIRAANDFAAKATSEQMQAAMDATTAKDFDAATGQKGKGPVHREAFAEELSDLNLIQAEINGRLGVQLQPLGRREAELNEKRLELAEHDTEISRLQQEIRDMTTPAKPPEGAPVRPGKIPVEAIARKRAELMFRENEAKPLRQAIQEEADAIRVKREEIQGEALEHRAYLESEIDRVVREEATAEKTPGSQKAERDGIDQLAGVEPPVRQRTPETFAERYDTLGTALQTIGKVHSATHDGTMPDNALRKDLSKLVDRYVSGPDQKAGLNQKIAQANTPGKVRKALESLGKHIHSAETRVARQDFEDALKKARHLRSDFKPQMDAVKRDVDKTNTDSLRDAAEALREITYRSATDDVLLNTERDASVTAAADQAAVEISKARPLAMVADDPVRKALGRVTPEDRITRGTADPVSLREGASRPEVQLARISPTLHKLVWSDLGVDAQAKYNDHTVETQDGFDAVLESLGIGRDDSLQATVKNLATGGRGTAFNQWRRTAGMIEGVPLKRGDAWFLVLADMDPRNAAVFNKGGWVFPDGRTIPKFNERVRNQLRDFVGPEGLKLAEWAFRYTNGPVIDRVNDAFVRARGRVLTEHKDVVPRVTEQTWDAVGESPFAALADPKLTGYGHLRHREDTAGPLTWPEGTRDGFDYMMRHWDRMNRIAAFLVPARDAQAVLNKSNVKNAILAKDGKEGLQNIQEAIRVQVNGPKRRTGEWEIRGRNAVAAAATIGFRLPTLMIQGTGTVLSAAWNPRGIRNFVKAMPALWSREIQAEMRQVLGQHSGHYRQKFLGNEYATEQSGGIYQQVDRFDPPSLAQHAMRPQRQIDHDVVAPLHYGQARARVVDQGVQPGTPEFGPAVAREWERSMYRGETASHGMELPGFLRSGVENAAVGIWATFQSQGARLWSLVPRATDLADKGQYKDAIAVAGVALASALATGTIRAFMSLRERDPEETTTEDITKNVALEFAGAPPIIGLFLQPLVRSAMKMRTYGDAPLVVEDVMDFAKATGQIASYVMEQGDAAEDKEKFFKNLISVTGSLAKFGGVPFGGIDDFRKRLEKGAAAEDVWSGLAAFAPGLQRKDKALTWQEAVDLLRVSE